MGYEELEKQLNQVIDQNSDVPLSELVSLLSELHERFKSDLDAQE